MATAALVGGCGSDGEPQSSAGTATTSASGDSAVAAVKQRVTQKEQRPTSIGLKTPIKGEIPRGKKIVYLSCGAPACEQVLLNLKDAAKVLGWEVQRFDQVGTSPEKIKLAWQQAVRVKPDAVVAAGGFEHSIYRQELEQLKQMNVPVVSFGDTQEATEQEGLVTLLLSTKEWTRTGKALADWVIADSDGKAKTVLQSFPVLSPLALQTKAFQDEMKAECPKCTTKVVEISPTDKNPAQKTATTVQAAPGTTHVVVAFSDLAGGLPSALAGTGVGDVRILSQNANSPVFEFIKKGEVAAGYAYPGPEVLWRVADTLIRLFNDESVKPDQTEPFPEWYITKENAAQYESGGPTVADYQEQYKKLWGLG